MDFFLRILFCLALLTQPAGQGSTTSTFTWDGRNQLTQQTIAGATTNASVLYAYDADGRRIQRVANGQVTNYLWDEASANGDVAVETDVSHTPQARYILGNGQLVAQERNSTTSFYLQDGQQNVRALADTSGNQTDTYLYDAYGNLQNRTGTTANPYQYTGQQFDSLTGLYNLRARNYDPTDGRFLTQDSLAFDTSNPLELNRYVYTADNPVTSFDPSGHQALVTFSLDTAARKTAVTTLAGGAAGLASSAFLVVETNLGNFGNYRFNTNAALDFIAQSELQGLVGGFEVGLVSSISPVAAGLVTLAVVKNGVESIANPGQISAACQAGALGVGVLAGGAYESLFTADSVRSANSLPPVGDEGNVVPNETPTTDEKSTLASREGNISSPNTGNPYFDRLLIDSNSDKIPEFSKIEADLAQKGYNVIYQALPNDFAAVRGKEVFIDPTKTRYIDLLHELVHVVQLDILESEFGLSRDFSSLGSLTLKSNYAKSLQGLLEMGAYQYEQDLANSSVFSDKYQRSLIANLESYWYQGVIKGLNSPTFNSILQSIANRLGIKLGPP